MPTAGTAIPPTPAAPTPTPAASKSKAVNLTVAGTDAIYLAGRIEVKIPPSAAENPAFPLIRCGGDLTETWPVSRSVTPGQTFTIKATGSVNFSGINELVVGPDGVPESNSKIDGLEGISGYNGPNGALVGVFLGARNLKNQPAPDPLDFTNAGIGVEFVWLAPKLGQVFFIGDGLAGTGSGSAQVFVVPGGATRLFLGIADGADFAGAPGCYNGNVGSFAAQVTLEAP